jgi:hypothetical protein
MERVCWDSKMGQSVGKKNTDLLTNLFCNKLLKLGLLFFVLEAV